MRDRPTVWVFGDQLNRDIASLRGHTPETCRVLLVESAAKLHSKPWHVQRLHVVISAMEHFAAELEAAGFDVDHRSATTLAEGLRDHVAQYRPERVIAMEPMSWDGRRLLERLGVDVVPNNQFLCHYDEFATWAKSRKNLTMEDFYRWQRARVGVLMDPDGPAGGRWNFDDENREPPPTDGRSCCSAWRSSSRASGSRSRRSPSTCGRLMRTRRPARPSSRGCRWRPRSRASS